MIPYNSTDGCPTLTGLTYLWRRLCPSSVHAVCTRKRYHHAHPLHRRGRGISPDSASYNTRALSAVDSRKFHILSFSLITPQPQFLSHGFTAAGRTEIMLRFELSCFNPF